MFKNKYVISTFIVLIALGTGILFFDGGRLFSGPRKIGGWEEVEQKLSKRFSNNEDLKKAAIQMGLALQAALDNPEDARNLEADVAAGQECVWGVLKSQGRDDIESEVVFTILDIVTAGFERERRYIRYNALLSGGVYSIPVVIDTSKCRFKIGSKNK